MRMCSVDYITGACMTWYMCEWMGTGHCDVTYFEITTRASDSRNSEKLSLPVGMFFVPAPSTETAIALEGMAKLRWKARCSPNRVSGMRSERRGSCSLGCGRRASMARAR